jgi:hypothetical protein
VQLLERHRLSETQDVSFSTRRDALEALRTACHADGAAGWLPDPAPAVATADGHWVCGQGEHQVKIIRLLSGQLSVFDPLSHHVGKARSLRAARLLAASELEDLATNPHTA